MLHKLAIPGQLDDIVLADVFVQINQAPKAAHNIACANIRSFGEAFYAHDQAGMPRTAGVFVHTTGAVGLDQKGSHRRGAFIATAYANHSTITGHLTFRDKFGGDGQKLLGIYRTHHIICGNGKSQVFKIKSKIVERVEIVPVFKHEQRIRSYMADTQTVGRILRVGGELEVDPGEGRIWVIQVFNSSRFRAFQAG
ncbi:hypothetical protein BK650_16250 [Pseudomonas rhodesiae]|nr:hypothetical protein BK650_16250 [Pseudomonas rhodesiae]